MDPDDARARHLGRAVGRGGPEPHRRCGGRQPCDRPVQPRLLHRGRRGALHGQAAIDRLGALRGVHPRVPRAPADDSVRARHARCREGAVRAAHRFRRVASRRLRPPAGGVLQPVQGRPAGFDRRARATGGLGALGGSSSDRRVSPLSSRQLRPAPAEPRDARVLRLPRRPDDRRPTSPRLPASLRRPSQRVRVFACPRSR